MKTALSIGNNATPNNQLEYMFVNFFWLTGILVFAMLIGQVRTHNFDRAYQSKKIIIW